MDGINGWISQAEATGKLPPEYAAKTKVWAPRSPRGSAAMESRDREKVPQQEDVRFHKQILWVAGEMCLGHRWCGRMRLGPPP